MSYNYSKNGYIGFSGMGNPIPYERRQIAYKSCIKCGYDADISNEAISQMVTLLEQNKPYDATLVARKLTGATITDVYKLITILLTDEI